MIEGWRQDLVGATHGRSEGFRALDDLVDQRAAQQRERASAHRRAGVVLASRDHLDGEALVATEALAVHGRGLELPLRMTIDGTYPAREVGDRNLGSRRTQHI